MFHGVAWYATLALALLLRQMISPTIVLMRNEPLAEDSKPVGGLNRHASRSSPGLRRFKEVHHPPPVSVPPRKGRDRQQFLLVQLKQAFDDGELENFGNNKDERAGKEMSRPNQITAKRLCWLQHDKAV